MAYIPSYETFRKEVIRLENADTFKSKYGADAARSRWGGGGEPYRSERICELAVQDDTTLDVFCVDLERNIPVGRPILTVIQDHFSRCILGHHVSFDPPSLVSAAEAIIHANTPKLVPARFRDRFPELEFICGKPSEIAWDNTLYQKARSMQSSFADVGIGLRLVGVGEATHKGYCERFFRTLRTLLISHLPGATFPIEMMKEFGYVPGRDAVLTLPELRTLIEEACATYHVMSHGGLMQRQPALVWRQGLQQGKVDLIKDRAAFRRAFGQLREGCTLTKSGVEVEGLRFSDARETPALLGRLLHLEPRRRSPKNPTAKVQVKLDPNNLQSIQAWDPTSRRYIELPCIHPVYASGLPLWLHKRIAAKAKKDAHDFCSEQDQLIVRAKLSDAVREFAPQMKMKERRLLARLQEAGSRPSSAQIEVGFADASPTGLSAVDHDLALVAEHVPPPTRAGRARRAPDKATERANRPIDVQRHVAEREAHWGWGEMYDPAGETDED